MDTTTQLRELQEEISRIKARNSAVELNKKWETSNVRRVSIAVLTYIVMSSFFVMTNTPNPLLSAVVPTMGFLLSTVSLGFIRKLWLRSQS
jgi:hypothetical protein